MPTPPAGLDFLQDVLPFVLDGLTHEGLEQAIRIDGDNLTEAAETLGTGQRISAQDTVPFCLWSAAHHLHDYEDALWWTAQGRGDRDTTCAIVGGIVALSAGQVPATWVQRREPLPDGFSRE
jgi:ADP-ribosylglycohydrolase